MRQAIPIKTPEQIDAMRHAGAILKQTLALMAREVKVGMNLKELDQIAEDFIRSHKGCTPGFKGMYGFPASVCMSVNDEVVHGIPDEEIVLEEGDVIGLDCGVYYKGMHTDACVTVIIGQAAPDVVHFVKTTKKALDNAIKVVKPGAHVGDISHVIQKTLEDQSYAPIVDCTGHGVGVDLHEPPEILNKGSKGSGPELKAGMVLAIEPISAMSGHGKVFTANDGWTVITTNHSLSAHFEHTVLVTEDGYEVLT